MDGVDNAVVGVDQLTFLGANGVRRILSLTLEQDLGFGPGGSPIPNVNQFGGTVDPEKDPAVALGLISHDGAIALGSADLSKVKDTRLTLAANVPSQPDAAPIQIDAAGQKLSLESLQLGSAVGVGGGVGGDANLVLNDLTVGGTGASNEALRAYGDVTVTGDVHVLGTTRFAGEGDQRLDVTGGLEIAGADFSKSTNGLLAIQATQGIDLTGETAQTIANEGGRLVIDGALIKGQFGTADDNGDGNLDPNAPPLRDPNDPNSPLAVGQRGLSLRGVSENRNDAAVVVTGTRPLNAQGPADQREYAIAIGNGDLSISAAVRGAGSSTTSLGKYELGGDVLAFGDVVLAGEGSFIGHKPSYTVEAQRNPFQLVGEVFSGELTMGGISSADGDLKLIARGDDPSFDIAHPSAIHLKGDFAGLSGDLEVDGSLDLAEDTSISAGGDIRFDDRIQGEKGLSVASKGQVVLSDDVALTAGALSLAGDSGVRFASTSDTQFIQAGSHLARQRGDPHALGRRDPRPRREPVAGGERRRRRGRERPADGRERIAQRVREELDLAHRHRGAAHQAGLARPDRAQRLDRDGQLDRLQRGPARDRRRHRHLRGADPHRGHRQHPERPGPAAADQRQRLAALARELLPRGRGVPGRFRSRWCPAPRSSTTRARRRSRHCASRRPARTSTRWSSTPRSPIDRSGPRSCSPIWSSARSRRRAFPKRSSTCRRSELARAIRSPPRTGASATPRPNEPSRSTARCSAPTSRAIPRPASSTSPARAAAIRAAFQQPIDALRRENGGKPVSGAALRELIASTPSFAPAQGYAAQLGQLVAAGELALTPEQKPRFSALVLSEVTPYGIAPAEFATAIR